MLVTLAVLLLMMTFIVKIFQAATGSLSAAQVYQELDNQLRLLDSTIRSDLNGVTATMTPPNNPKNNKGYFEYGENEFADLQGEDSDDYIRFTAKAPAGQPFTGRMWVPPPIPLAMTARSSTTWPPSRSRSPASTRRSSTSCATATSTAACSWCAPERQSAIEPSVDERERPSVNLRRLLHRSPWERNSGPSSPGNSR